MTVANFDDNSIRHVDGRFDVERRGQRDIIEACVRNPQRLHTINQILASPRIHNSAEWTFICHPYLREINNAACGPILILAFYHEYFGEPLFGVGVVVYDEDLRRRLVEIHVQHFGQQDQSDNISPPESYRSNLNTMDERLDATPWWVAHYAREARQEHEHNAAQPGTNGVDGQGNTSVLSWKGSTKVSNPSPKHDRYLLYEQNISNLQWRI